MTDIIESNPEILGGKPIIKGTRITVALIYELFGLNYSIAEIFEGIPPFRSQCPSNTPYD
jgi:uncharacterized protein (DUF433 family)